MTRILVFSPYACRYHQFVYEATIAKACQIRGATVEYLLCDGLLPECDMHWDSFPDHAPRPFDLCSSCQARAKRNLRELDLPFRDLPYRWLGEFVDEAEKATAFAWAQRLTPAEMSNAGFQGGAVGDWVQSSLISYFRKYPPDMSDWRVVNVCRSFLFGAAIVSMALRRYLDAHAVDAALLFNGRQSVTRVAFEIFRGRGLRVLTHELPFYQRGRLNVKPNARCWSLEPFRQFWQMWGPLPLDRPSLEQTLSWLRNRRYAKDLSWQAFNEPYRSSRDLREELKLSRERRLLALFTSSTDEFEGDPDYVGPYESQGAWVREVVDWVKGRADLELVIRVHPNLAGGLWLGKAESEYRFFADMASGLPANVRLIMPDDPVNSYALTDIADVGLTFGSSIGFEMAMLGKPVVLAGRGIYEDLEHVLVLRSRTELPEILEKSLAPFPAQEARREAFRFAYYYVFKYELPFPLISRPGIVDARLNYSDSQALAPGNDASLDGICGYLLHGHSPFPSPRDNDRGRTPEEEDAFFAELDRLAEPMRDLRQEAMLARARSARATQKAIHRLARGMRTVLSKIGKTATSSISRRPGRNS